jgi:hypothetical protein
LELKVVDTAFTIMGLAREEGPTVEQMTLPLRHGGLGLSCTDPALASAAYHAAAAATHTAMREEPFRPSDGPSGALLRPQWGALHEGAGGLWKPELREVNPDSLGRIAEAQGAYMRHAAKIRFDALLASYDAGSEASKRGLVGHACIPAWPGPRTTVVRNSVFAGFVLLLSGLDGAVCNHF